MSTKAPTLTLDLNRFRSIQNLDSTRPGAGPSDKEMAMQLMAEVNKLQSGPASPRIVTDLDSDDEPSSSAPQIPRIDVFESPHPQMLTEEPNWEEDDVFPANDGLDDRILFDDDDVDALLTDEPGMHKVQSMSPDSSIGGSSHSSVSDFNLSGNPFATALMVSPPLNAAEVDPEPIWRRLLAQLEQSLVEKTYRGDYSDLKQRKGGSTTGMDYEHTFEATKANASLNRLGEFCFAPIFH